MPAIRSLHGGGIIACPTESVWGLACRADCEAAIQRLRTLKRRPRSKAFIVVAAEFRQLRGLLDIAGIDPGPIMTTWPGPVTWVFPAGCAVPDWLCSGERTLAVRVSAHPTVAALCRRVGPLVSTSANPAGLPPARTAARVRAYFGRRLDAISPGVLGRHPRPTEIRIASSGEVIRKGG